MKELLKAYVNSCNERLPEEQMKLLSDDLLESLFRKRMTNMYTNNFLDYEVKYFKKFIINIDSHKKFHLLNYGIPLNIYDNLNSHDYIYILFDLDRKFNDFYDFCMGIDIDYNTRQIKKKPSPFSQDWNYNKFKKLLNNIINSYHILKNEFITILHERNYFTLNDILLNNHFNDVIFLLQEDRELWLSIKEDTNDEIKIKKIISTLFELR